MNRREFVRTTSLIASDVLLGPPDDDEIRRCLATLRRTHAGTGFMHESFDKDAPNCFTRPWFAWANTMFGKFMLKLDAESPRRLS